MADQKLNPAFQLSHFPHGDPPILLEAILREVDEGQQKQVIGLYLDSVAATLQANLTFVQGARNIVAGGAARGQAKG